MASLRLCGAAARIPAAQVVVDTHHRRSFQLLKLGPNQLPSNLRQERLQVRQGLLTTLASYSNPSGAEGDSVQDKTSDAPQGPPFLTILAGLLVFVLVCWILGSTIIWLTGLFVKLFPSK
ncbi:hypothetical protein Q3G72_012905 [Acer saccharum]|nr:hypothetical protein Q3G72_012905 [Acer saccharum]